MVGSVEVYDDKLIKTSSFKKQRQDCPGSGLYGGEVISGSIIELHSGILELTLALAFLFCYYGYGRKYRTQSSTITVRGLATGQLRIDELWRNVWAETKVGFLISSTVGLLISSLPFLAKELCKWV